MGAVHALRVKSPYKLLRIENIKIENKPNKHGYLYLKCLIDDSINVQSTIKASTNDKICVYEELENEDSNESTSSSEITGNINVVNEENSKRLFNGVIQNVRTTNTDGVYYLEIQALTSSFQLDIKEKSRSFQNANMTYDELIGMILKDYSGYGFVQEIAIGEKIGKPLFQYKETDWDFLKRIASELESELFCDITEIHNMFYFGRHSIGSHKLDDIKHYTAHKNLQRYRETGGIETGHDTDYFYYEIEKREKYEIGDNIYFKNKELYVNQYSAYALKDEVIYKYRLCRKNGVWQTKIYNSFLNGASIEGKVLAVEGEKVKVHLNIDEKQNKDEASWFAYAPPTGNIMYSMPIVGTSAKLYFPNETSEDPIITGCVRNNGSSCPKTSDTTKRYLGTEHGSEIEMIPNALNIKGGSPDPLSISFDDNIGVTLTSHQKLTIDAKDDIIMKTPKSVKIQATSQLLINKTGTQSGISMETDIHFLSNEVIENGRDREAFAAIDNTPPEPVKKVETVKKEEKKGFDWGKLGKNVLAGLAVVAVVTVAAVAIAVTAGAATGVVVAIGVSAAVSGTAAVASQAISDVKRGEVSDIKDYMWAGGREAFIGAVSGAIFGPFGATEALAGKMALGGVTNGFESVLRQTIEGKGIDFKTVLLDTGFGAVTGGLFHGAGKMFEKASPFVKNAFSKVISKNESGLLNVAKKIDDLLAPMGVAELSNGRKVLYKMEGNTTTQDTMSKMIEKSNKNILVHDINSVLTTSNKFTKPMAKELETGIKNKNFAVSEVDDAIGKYKLDVLDDDGNATTSVLLDKDGNTVQMSWIVDEMGERGNQYKNSIVPPGTDKGHIKSIQDGALDNCIEDSPLNIIPQSSGVNKSRMKMFENYRRKECQGMQVITDMLPDGYVRVQVPEQNIDVTYNPLSTTAKTEWADDWFTQSRIFH